MFPESFSPKKVYYYVICAIAFFVLMWGVIDFTSASLSLLISNPAPSPAVSSTEEGLSGEAFVPPPKEQSVEEYYQRRMLMDRFGDSLARMIISGLIFAYARWTVVKLEGGQ
jgi:hypothetical protein